MSPSKSPGLERDPYKEHGTVSITLAVTFVTNFPSFLMKNVFVDDIFGKSMN